MVNELLGEEVPIDQPLMEAGLDSIGEAARTLQATQCITTTAGT